MNDRKSRLEKIIEKEQTSAVIQYSCSENKQGTEIYNKENVQEDLQSLKQESEIIEVLENIVMNYKNTD
jgi:hypothetical protein